jgi:hypothetical protein
LTLPNGQPASVAIGANVTTGLQASQPNVASAEVTFDITPPLPVEVAPHVVGGGQLETVDNPLDIKVGLRDGAGNPVALATDVGQATVDITLPILPTNDPLGEFHWLYELMEDGVPVGYTWSPYEVVDPATGTVTITLVLEELQGTLFLPASVTPGFVQNHDPLVQMWSGPTREARNFGLAGPQFTTFTVVAPQVRERLFVYSPVVSNYAWIDAAGVGPSGPPQ